MPNEVSLDINGMIVTPNPIPVAFLFFTAAKDWQGGKNYFRSLFFALDADPDRTVSVHVFIGKRLDLTEFDFPPSITIIRSTALDRLSVAWFFDEICRRVLGRAPMLGRLLRRHGIRLVSHSDPRNSGGLRNIAWIPDFQHIHLPHFFQAKDLKRRDSEFKIMLKRSDRVIVSSYAANVDLQQFSSVYINKVRVLQFCSVRPDLRFDDCIGVEHVYGLQAPFFYLPNQFWAHKNHRLAIEALALLRIRFPEVQIVCSGLLSDARNTKHVENLQQRIAELGLVDHFKLLGLIPYKHIAKLMVRSAAVINPSYFEGWSTTVEEAKCLAVPLLLSDIAVHHEQCAGDEAMFFNPDDAEALAQCMAQVLEGKGPSVITSDLMEKALEKHHLRMQTFARSYQMIVSEVNLADHLR